MAHVDVNGCKLWYELKGSGDYLLQIGGAGFAHENFGFVTDAMQKRVSGFKNLPGALTFYSGTTFEEATVG